MSTQSLAFSLPLPSPFNKAPPSVPGDLVPRADTINQYVIQLTIPSSEAATPSVEIPTANPRRSGKAKASIMIWAGIGRLKQSRSTTNGNGNGQVEMNAYEKALAEEMDGSDGSEVAQQFEGSRKLGEDWACAIPTTLQGNPVASSTLMNGIEADASSGSARAGRARGMAERLAKRFQTQIFLSLDIPPATSLIASLDSTGSRSATGLGPGGGLPGLDPLGDKLYLGLEKALGRALEEALAGRV